MVQSEIPHKRRRAFNYLKAARHIDDPRTSSEWAETAANIFNDLGNVNGTVLALSHASKYAGAYDTDREAFLDLMARQIRQDPFIEVSKGTEKTRESTHDDAEEKIMIDVPVADEMTIESITEKLSRANQALNRDDSFGALVLYKETLQGLEALPGASYNEMYATVQFVQRQIVHAAIDCGYEEMKNLDNQRARKFYRDAVKYAEEHEFPDLMEIAITKAINASKKGGDDQKSVGEYGEAVKWYKAAITDAAKYGAEDLREDAIKALFDTCIGAGHLKLNDRYYYDAIGWYTDAIEFTNTYPVSDIKTQVERQEKAMRGVVDTSMTEGNEMVKAGHFVGALDRYRMARKSAVRYGLSDLLEQIEEKIDMIESASK